MRIVVIGAGLSGLVAARELQEAGHDVAVIDKGRSPGGRMATRREGEARFDHGAQFFTVRDALFQQQVDGWLQRGLVHEWCRGFDSHDGHPRYVATGGMNTLAKDLAQTLAVQCSVTATSVAPQGAGWVIRTVDTGDLTCDKVLVTSPIPQTVALLSSSGVEIPTQIATCSYNATVALLAVVSESPNTLGEYGGLQDPDDVFSFIGDNARKGISPLPAITFHVNPQWSAQHFEQSDEWLHKQLLASTQRWLSDVTVMSSQVKKWRYATPQTVWPERLWMNEAQTLCLAGDVFGGPKVEGAYLSGHFAGVALA